MCRCSAGPLRSFLRRMGSSVQFALSVHISYIPQDGIRLLVPSLPAVPAPECQGQDGGDCSVRLATPSPATGTTPLACGSCLLKPLTSATDEGAPSSILQMGKPRRREVGVAYSLRHDHSLLPQGVEGLRLQAQEPAWVRGLAQSLTGCVI